ncbi:GerMN domain-containing protein [Thermodesulfovibrio hydrogeniphilus]
MNKKWILIGIIIFVLASAGAFSVLFYFNKGKNDNDAKSQTNEKLPAFKIYLPNSKLEHVFLEMEKNEMLLIEKILEIYIRQLPSPLNTTRILGLYRDKENTIYLDLSRNFINQSDASEEFDLLKSIYMTLKENFSWIQDVKILIEGKEVETLSGHFSIEKSLKNALEDK